MNNNVEFVDLYQIFRIMYCTIAFKIYLFCIFFLNCLQTSLFVIKSTNTKNIYNNGFCTKGDYTKIFFAQDTYTKNAYTRYASNKSVYIRSTCVRDTYIKNTSMGNISAIKYLKIYLYL